MPLGSSIVYFIFVERWISSISQTGRLPDLFDNDLHLCYTQACFDIAGEVKNEETIDLVR
jgi:hypothetical protein